MSMRHCRSSVVAWRNVVIGVEFSLGIRYTKQDCEWISSFVSVAVSGRGHDSSPDSFTTLRGRHVQMPPSRLH